MFTKITFRNYRTHKLTTIELQPVTLLIGNNNSGKSNLLAGIQHFSDLVKRGDPDREESDRVVSNEDFFPHRYRFANNNEPMSIEVESNQITFDGIKQIFKNIPKSRIFLKNLSLAVKDF